MYATPALYLRQKPEVSLDEKVETSRNFLEPLLATFKSHLKTTHFFFLPPTAGLRSKVHCLAAPLIPSGAI